MAVLSEAFYKWDANTNAMKKTLTSNIVADSRPSPRFFYPTSSAHLSQSDFGILFDWLIKRVLKTEQPAERYIKLNARAILQTLREVGYEVSDTSAKDREEDEQTSVAVATVAPVKTGDWRILDPNGDIPGWKMINVDRPKVGSASPVRGRSPSAHAAKETEVLGEMAA